jgi:hypothetical protein
MSGGGFPSRPSLSNFGPTLENAVPVRDPSRELDAAVFNLLRQQVAGMGLLVPRVIAKLTVANPTLLLAHAEAWNPEGLTTGEFAAPTPAFVSTGRCTLTYSQQVPDELDEEQNIAFSWGFGWYSADPPTVRKSVQVEPIAATPYILSVCVFNASDALENGNNVWIVAG